MITESMPQDTVKTHYGVPVKVNYPKEIQTSWSLGLYP